jgi:hypothetical protein
MPAFRSSADGNPPNRATTGRRRGESAAEGRHTICSLHPRGVRYRLMHGHGRLSTADRERLARGLAKTVGAVQKQEASPR